MNTPFKFLDAYTKEDKDIFFGRDNEIEELYQKVFDSKVLLVCGVSGTGKTSLINCGLANKFEESDWLPINIRRGNDITSSLKSGISKSAITPIKENQTIIKQLQSLYLDHFKPIYLIFDQFEEVFIFGSKEERKEFIKEIKKIIDSDVQCRLLFVMREESLAGAIEFEREIPTFLTNRIRIERMTWHNAREVIEEPCKVHGIEVEEGLAENILGKLSPESTEVELTYLQVLLDKLYRLAKQKDEENPVFSNELLKSAGDVSDLLGSFLEEQINQLDDPETGLIILKSFVSVRGTKRQVTSQDITDFAATLGKTISEEDLKILTQKFINLRILRDKDDSGRYELRHDSLATKIYEKITLYEKELLEVRQFLDNAYNNFETRNKLLGVDDLDYIAPYERKLFLNPDITRFIQTSKREVQKAKNRRRQVISVISIALIALLSGFTIWALNEREKAIEQGSIAEEQKNAAIEANLETEKAREEAVKEKSRAEENEHLALEQRKEAINANEALVVARKQATEEKIKAEENEQIAIASQQEAENLRSLAEEEKVRADNQRDLATENFKKAKASELLIKVFEIANTDPTLALRLAEYALDLTGSDQASAVIQQVYSENNFYKIVARHRYPINAVDISPDGKKILTGSSDHTACLWDISGKKLLEIDSHKHEVTSVKFTGDGKYFLTGSRDKTACLWDLSGNLIRTLSDHQGSVTSVAISPDGKTIITGSEDLWTRVWLPDGEVAKLYSRFPIVSVAFSPTGTHFLFAFERNSYNLIETGSLKMVRNDVGKPIYYLEDGTYIPNAIMAIAFSPDGQKIITGSADRQVRIWNLNGRLDNTIGGFEEPITAVAYSPDGQRIVIGFENGEIYMMAKNGSVILQEYKGHTTAISSMTFSKDGRYLLTGSMDNTARIWDVSAESVQGWQTHEQGVNRIIYSPDGKNLLTGSMDGTAALWDLQGNKLVSYQGHQSEILSLAFSEDGKYVFTGSLDKTMQLWDLSGESLAVFRGHESAIGSIDYSADLNQIITGSDDNTARLWSPDGELISIAERHEDPVHGTAFLPGGKGRISAAGRYVFIMDEKGNIIRRIGNPSGGMVWTLDLSPDGETILMTDANGLYRFDFDGNLVDDYIPLKYKDNWISNIDYSSDGEQMVCSYQKKLLLFDKSGNIIKHLTEDPGNKETEIDMVWGLAFAPDGTSVAASHRNGMVSFFQLKTPLKKFQEYGRYEELSLYQKLDYELVADDDLHAFESEQDVLEASLFYLEKAKYSKSINVKIEYLRRSDYLFNMLQDFFYSDLYLIGQANVLNRLIVSNEDREVNKARLDTINSHLLGSDQIRVLNDAAELYNGLSMESFSTDQKVDFANRANIFYERILQIDNSTQNAGRLVDNLIHLQLINPSDSIDQKLDTVFYHMLDQLNVSELREKERYFYQKAVRSTEHRIAAEYYNWSVILIERIIARGRDNRFYDHASSTYNNLAHAQLFTGQYDDAIRNAKRGIELNDENIIHTKLALAFLLNDQYRQAEAVIEEYKNKSVGNETFKEYLESKIIELEGSGIKHPDFEKVQKLF